MFIRILEPIEYHYALMMMKKTLKMRIEGKMEDHIYFLEHKPVVTLGKDGKLENIMVPHIRIPIFNVKRGGDVTLHSPGQLVVYPIIKLDEIDVDLRQYIRMLEESIINVLKEYGLEGYWKRGTAGVWVRGKKIASIGIALDHWTTYHGLAFNISNDLSLFNLIRPCGLEPREMTSLEREIGEKIDFEDVFKKVLEHLSKSFNVEYQLKYMHKKEVIDLLYEEIY